MLSVCRDLLQQDPSLVDIWTIVANLYAANNEVEATRQVCTLYLCISTKPVEITALQFYK